MLNTERMNAIFDAAENDLVTMSEARQQAIEIVEEQQEEYDELAMLAHELQRIWREGSDEISKEIKELKKDIQKQREALNFLDE